MFQQVADWIAKNQDVVFVICVIAILITIFVPLPTPLMDLLLVTNITLSMLIMLTVIYVREPLRFSVFPSVLLLSTAFRLALNIATTRLILTNAGVLKTEAAGKVIKAFGEFVAQREPVIGFIIFLILVIVNFIVITKGANRISEVAARFTLDAMPGKQMAIDADLNAGLIKEAEARHRRELISREADFYGAMDGATKFVRGDAIAGIIITLINIIGGFIIGLVKLGWGWKEALYTFTLLTIGDGLVSQIPALIVSISAGLIVTRATAESNLGREFMGQIFSDWKILLITAIFLGFLALTPLPTIPLLLIGTIVFILSRVLKQASERATRIETIKKEKEAARRPERVEGLLHVDPMELEIGYGLIRMVDPDQGGMLLERVTRIRRQMALDLGIVVPPIRIRDNIQLEPNQYVIKIRGVKVAEGFVMPDNYLAMDSGVATGPIEGIRTKEPAFGLPAYWITEQEKQKAEALGYTVVDATTVLSTHLTEVIKSHAADLLTREDVNTLLRTLEETNPSVVKEVVPNVLKPGEVQKVLQNLLREGVSIRDLGSILETLSDYAPRIRDPEILTEYVRNALARSICHQYIEKEGRMYVITLDPKLEDLIRSAIERTEHGSYLSMSPVVFNKVVERISKEVQRLMSAGHSPVILCSPQIRYHVKRITEQIQPGIAVLSYNEILKDVRVESMGMVSVEV
jgi:flagellar biosynthesis protein FlhA